MKQMYYQHQILSFYACMARIRRFRSRTVTVRMPKVWKCRLA